MLKVAILDDYQNVSQEFVDLQKLSGKYEFKIFSDPFLNEADAIEQLSDFEALLIMRERTPITKNLIDNLLSKIELLSIKNNLNRIVLGGGVSANSYLKKRLDKESKKNNWEVFIPELEYTTDNAAMIGIVGHLKYKESIESSLNATPSPRLTF